MAARGKRAAFGDGKRIIWGPWSEEIFRHNPNVARPGSERDRDIEWVDYYKGNRHYNRLDRNRGRWAWNYDFKATPGEIFFSREEVAFGESHGSGFVLVEPNVPWHKSVAVNKDWGLQKYQSVVDLLLSDGRKVVQTAYGRDKLRGVKFVTTPNFRSALALLKQSAVAVLPEGGLHHGAAALCVPAVVIFGGFIPPEVTGYRSHINLTGGPSAACGSLQKCAHCRAALDKISVDEVYQSVKRFLWTHE